MISGCLETQGKRSGCKLETKEITKRQVETSDEEECVHCLDCGEGSHMYAYFKVHQVVRSE